MPVHIEIHEIRVFKAVYEEHGFKKAADKLFVTQSAVSQTIANLERKLDTVLLERNPLKLTQAGIRLLNYADAVLSEEQNVLTDIGNIKNGILSTLLLAINGTVNTLYASHLMTAYCDVSPLTRLQLNIMPSRQIISAITSDLWELGFGPFQQQMPDIFHTIALFEDTRQLTISRHHPGYRAFARDPEALSRRVPLIVSHLDDPDMRPAIQKLRDSFGTIWEVNDMGLRMNLVARGLAMSYLDRRMIAVHPDSADMVAIDSLSFANIRLTYGVYHRKRKQLSMGAQKFIEVCRSFDFSQD
jgi:DNA-binding transcriptional LysR family regulator